jgi:hypothetical protein
MPTLIQFIGVTNIVNMPAVSGLFLICLTTVYLGNKLIIAFLCICWLIILGIFIFNTTTIFPQILAKSRNDGQSMKCFMPMETDTWGFIGTAAYDTLMYFAISWHLASFTMGGHWNS